MTEPTLAMPRPEPIPAQTAAFEFLFKNQHEIQRAILQVLLPFYNSRRPDYREFLGRDFKLLMPKASDVPIFRELISPGTIYLHSVAKDRMACIGFSFGTSWEVEHALGFILLGNRVVKVGEAETAFESLAE